MKQLKCIIKSFVLISLILSLSGCEMLSNAFNKDKDDNGGGGGNAGKTVQFVRFKPAGAKVLGLVDKSDGPNASARNATTDAMIVKILEDGSIQSFMEFPEGTTGDIKEPIMIAQSPDPNTNCFFVVLSGISNFTTPQVKTDEDGNEWVENTQMNLGQVLCVFDDGHYTDFIARDYENLIIPLLDTDIGLIFDNNGNVYYLLKELDFDGNGNAVDYDLIYKYAPNTNTVTLLTERVEHKWFKKMQVSADGQWLFAYSSRSQGANYVNTLRAIPVSNPEAPIDVFYSSTGASICDWIYDDDTECLYYSNVDGIHKIPKVNGTFAKANDTLLCSEATTRWTFDDKTNGLFEKNENAKPIFTLNETASLTLYSSTNHDVYKYDGEDLIATGNSLVVPKKTYLFKNILSEQKEIQPEEIYEYILDKAGDSLPAEVTNGYILDKDPDGKHSYVYKSRLTDKYYISFKKFAEEKGFEELATATEGKTNLDAIKAILDNKLEGLLGSLFLDETEGTPYKLVDATTGCYSRNFYADILYNLDGEDKDKPISTDLIKKHYTVTDKYETKGIYLLDMFTYDPNTNEYIWKSELKDGDSLDAKKVLEKLTSICVQGEIDFKLTAFKDDAKYNSLYTDKINEEAIKFLDTPENLKTLTSYIQETNCYNYSHAKFLNVTCFVKGTEESAFPLSAEDDTYILWAKLENMTTAYGKSLYANDEDGFVEIVDENGIRKGVRLHLEGSSKLHVVSTLSADDGVYFLNGIDDGQGGESGKHNILFYDVQKEELRNLFEKVGNDLEVFSFSGGKNALYFSAAKGFNIINGKIDTQTGNYEVLSSGQKLSQIIVVK